MDRIAHHLAAAGRARSALGSPDGAPASGAGSPGSASLALLFFATAPVGALLLRPLEARFPPPPADMKPPYGIIVLGGAIVEDLSAAHGQTIFSEGASRLTEAAILARRFPEARIVYTGGSASLTPHYNSTEAAEAKKLLVALGVDPGRIAIEPRSRNTDENARFTAAMVAPKPDQTWLLVTSAWHIPRSMGLFRKAGFNVVAYPVDYHTFGDDRDLQDQSRSRAEPSAVRDGRPRMDWPDRLSRRRQDRRTGFPRPDYSIRGAPSR